MLRWGCFQVHRVDSLRQTFSIQEWSALAAGMSSQTQWLAWAQQPYLPPEGDLDVPLSDFPAMSRRRLSTLGKMAVAVADNVQHAAQIDWSETPVVWASRYGDAHRSLQLLHSQVQGEPMSPTAFGLSVHNGIAAQHSIARKVHANSLCVAAGVHTAEAGLVEAAGLLQEGAPQVLLVCYDAPLPDSYAQFHGEPMCAYAWAWLMTAANPHSGLATSVLQAMPSAEPASHADLPNLPHGLQVLQSMLSHTPYTCNGWRWEHADA